MLLPSLHAQQERTESYLGSLAPVVRSIQKDQGFPLSYENRRGLPLKEWKRKGRVEVQRAMSCWPKSVPLDLKVHTVERREGYEVRTVSFAGSPHYRIPAYLLAPTVGKGPYPAIVALHDHAAWFSHGKEKLVRMEGEHLALKGFREHYYSGRAYAEDLAKRGYVVIVPDAFYWGERRLQYEQPPAELQELLAGLKPEQPEYLAALHKWLREQTAVLKTWLSFTGMTWMGIVNHDDRRSVDVLVSLPEVDAKRVGCVGLSGGGYRSTYLTGMEPRIKASVIVGFMVSLPTVLDMPRPVHWAMFDATGAHSSLDHPDIASLAAPECAIFVQNCARDSLFTREGMEAAAGKIQAVYADLRRPERFRSKFFDAPHQFNAEMQEEAFAWFDRWLKTGR